MSDIRSRIADDEYDWDCLKRHLNIDVKWQVYSIEARYAKYASEKLNLTGREIISYVELMLARDKRIQLEKVNKEEYNLYLSLKEKYKDK